MLSRWTTTESSITKTCLAVLVVLCVSGSGAYAFYARDEPDGKPLVPAPSITAKPAKGTPRTSARFAYTDRWHRVRFQCSLDSARFSSCRSPTRYPGPFAGGSHIFRVRALDWSHGRRELSRTVSYKWLVDLQPPAPYIAHHPIDPTSATKATFTVTDGEPRVTLQCSIDRRSWRKCSSHISYDTLTTGEHHFQVRAIDPPAIPSPVTHFNWLVAAPPASESFAITFDEVVGGPLYPGATPQTIRLTLVNPHDTPIFITSLNVSVPGGPPGCDPATNLSLLQSNVSSVAPLAIGAHDSLTLPAQGYSAPTIGLLNLPINQDACRNALFPLNFTGTAHS